VAQILDNINLINTYIYLFGQKENNRFTKDEKIYIDNMGKRLTNLQKLIETSKEHDLRKSSFEFFLFHW